MKRILKIMGFVFAMGSITSLLIIGMDALTFERILANEQALFQSKVLDAFEVPYTTATINEVFIQNVEAIELDLNGERLTVYRDPRTGRISMEISGGGVWGPIIGVLTLEPDFVTIAKVAILQQEETPGLGGRITEPAYLAKYVGVVFKPDVVVTKNTPSADNEVDAITGATGTSTRFQIILNDTHAKLFPLLQALEN
jgi:Na+-transporting NADH:ubiquinone oxidoreductase subunit C